MRLSLSRELTDTDGILMPAVNGVQDSAKSFECCTDMNVQPLLVQTTFRFVKHNYYVLLNKVTCGGLPCHVFFLFVHLQTDQKYIHNANSPMELPLVSDTLRWALHFVESKLCCH